MKILKVTGIVVLVMVALFFAIASALPSQVHVERSLVIPASSEVVFAQINDLRQWKHWSPWHQKDPQMKVTYEGKLKGVGATYRWESSKVGNGKLSITESRPFEYIATDLDFLEQGKAVGFYHLTPVTDGTMVTWEFETDMGNNPAAKYLGLLMDRMIGPDFEQGLSNLKKYVVALPPVVKAQEIPKKKR